MYNVLSRRPDILMFGVIKQDSDILRLVVIHIYRTRLSALRGGVVSSNHQRTNQELLDSLRVFVCPPQLPYGVDLLQSSRVLHANKQCLLSAVVHARETRHDRRRS